MSSADPPPPTAIEDRLLALIRRELGADHARIVDAETRTDEQIGARLPDGRQVVAEFVEEPQSRDVLVRRLELLVAAFAHSLEVQARRPTRRLPPALSLRDELRAVAGRARACDAFVIDAHSPVVWGSASGFEQPDDSLSTELFDTVRLIDVSRAELLALTDPEGDSHRPLSEAPPSRDSAVPPAPPAPSAGSAEAIEGLTLHALDVIRGLSGITELRRGRVLHHSHRGDEFGYTAHSFAGIYLLVLVFDASYDELRAERAVHDALARVERLVLALPPHDPSPAPTANVVRLARRRR